MGQVLVAAFCQPPEVSGPITPTRASEGNQCVALPPCCKIVRPAPATRGARQVVLAVTGDVSAAAALASASRSTFSFVSSRDVFRTVPPAP
jgi:hypothetical protein